MIEDGCNQFCSYCVVPLARGRVKSKPLPEVLSEAEKLIANGAKEIVLTGINLGAYGRDQGSSNQDQNLSQVITKLAKLEGLERLRLSSIEPMFITDELIKTLASTLKVCRHLHIPLQSGDDLVLKKMNRTYSSKDFLTLIQKLRSAMPKIAISTDIIAGFPGEDDEAFENTCELIEKVGFSRLHVFRYSKRKNTPASQFDGHLAPWIINQRSRKLRYLKTKQMRCYHKQFLGQILPVLVEQKGEGLTDNYLRVMFTGDESLVGKLVPVKIKELRGEELLGELAS